MSKQINEKLYIEKRAKEIAWYESSSAEKETIGRRLFRSKVIYSMDRVIYSYIFPKRQLVEFLQRKQKKHLRNVFIAACGRGDDYKYFDSRNLKIYGMDLSQKALSLCPSEMRRVNGDLLSIPFTSCSFDLVVVSLFFHHVLDFGFSPFLSELHRILKPGGAIIILEPSALYPLNLITRPIKRLFRNPFDEVEDERPFLPSLMVHALNDAGFLHTCVQAATYSHPAFFIPLAKFINSVSKPLLNLTPLKYFGWLLLYWAEKAD